MVCSGELPTKSIEVGHAQPQTSHTYPLMLSSAMSFLSGMAATPMAGSDNPYFTLNDSRLGSGRLVLGFGLRYL
jgi:hypothetical protein